MYEFNEKNYLQTHGVAMGTKTAMSFANNNIHGGDQDKFNSTKHHQAKRIETLHSNLMMFSPFGTVQEMKRNVLLNILTHSTQQ